MSLLFPTPIGRDSFFDHFRLLRSTLLFNTTLTIALRALNQDTYNHGTRLIRRAVARFVEEKNGGETLRMHVDDLKGLILFSSVLLSDISLGTSSLTLSLFVTLGSGRPTSLSLLFPFKQLTTWVFTPPWLDIFDSGILTLEKEVLSWISRDFTLRSIFTITCQSPSISSLEAFVDCPFLPLLSGFKSLAETQLSSALPSRLSGNNAASGQRIRTE